MVHSTVLARSIFLVPSYWMAYYRSIRMVHSVGLARYNALALFNRMARSRILVHSTLLARSCILVHSEVLARYLLWLSHVQVIFNLLVHYFESIFTQQIDIDI